MKDEKVVEPTDEMPEQTDNEARPEDGEQDLSQDPTVEYASEVEDDE